MPSMPTSTNHKKLTLNHYIYNTIYIWVYAHVIRGPLKYNRKSFNHPNQHENHHPRTQSKAHQPDLPSRRCRRHQLDTGFLRKARVECKGCARLELLRRNLSGSVLEVDLYWTHVSRHPDLQDERMYGVCEGCRLDGKAALDQACRHATNIFFTPASE